MMTALEFIHAELKRLHGMLDKAIADLTPAQLKITWTALKSYLDDFGHDERDVAAIAREVLAKLPDEHAIRPIDIGRGR